MPKEGSADKQKNSAKNNEERERQPERGTLSNSEREASQSKENRRKDFSVHDPKSPNADT